MVRVGNIVKIIRGVSYSEHDAHYSKRNGDCLILRGGNILEDGHITTNCDNVYVNNMLVSDEQHIRKNDIVIVSSTASTRVIGKPGVIDANYDDVAHGAFLLLIRPLSAPNVFAPYVSWYFRTSAYRDEIKHLVAGGVIQNIRLEHINNLLIPLPPMDEQIAIAETLSALDRHLSNLSELIAKKQAIRQGALEDLMTGRTRLWGFTGDWKTVKLGDVFDFKNGLNKAKEFFGHGTPIINYMDVYHHSAIRASDIHGTVELTANEIRRFNARKNDVFFTRTSETPEEVGFAAVLLDDIDDCVFSGFVLRARPKNDLLLPEYCQYCFAAKAVRREIIKYCTYTTRALTNGRILSAIVIPLPPLEEQSAIAHSLAALDSEISALNAQRAKLSAIRSAAINDLLSGKIRLSL